MRLKLGGNQERASQARQDAWRLKANRANAKISEPGAPRSVLPESESHEVKANCVATKISEPGAPGSVPPGRIETLIRNRTKMADPITLKYNTTVLAYMGDAIYEVYIREKLIADCKGGVDKIHHNAVKYVSAEGQAKAIKMMAGGFLDEDEVKIYKRGRNHRATSRPKNADPKNYKVATGFEALIGYLYLSEQKERMEEVIREAIRIIDEE